MFEEGVGVVPDACVVVLVSNVVVSFVVVVSAGVVGFAHAAKNPAVKIPKPIVINFFRLIVIIPF